MQKENALRNADSWMFLRDCMRVKAWRTAVSEIGRSGLIGRDRSPSRRAVSCRAHRPWAFQERLVLTTASRLSQVKCFGRGLLSMSPAQEGGRWLLEEDFLKKRRQKWSFTPADPGDRACGIFASLAVLVVPGRKVLGSKWRSWNVHSKSSCYTSVHQEMNGDFLRDNQGAISSNLLQVF